MTVLACVTITDGGGLLVLSGVEEAPALVAGGVVVTCLELGLDPESESWLGIAVVLGSGSWKLPTESSTPVNKTVQVLGPPPQKVLDKTAKRHNGSMI